MRTLLPLLLATFSTSCASAAQTEPPVVTVAEQPAQVVAPVAKAPAPRADGALRGDVAGCTTLLRLIREQAEAVSRAYEAYEKTADLRSFSLQVRTAANLSASVAVADPKLKGIASRYRDALLHQVEETERGAGGRAIAEESAVIDEVTEYCGMQAAAAPIDE